MPDPTWDLADQDCDALDGGWAKNIVGTGDVTLVIEDGKDCYKIENTGVLSTDLTNANFTPSDWNNDCTIEIVFKYVSDTESETITTQHFSLYARSTDKHQFGARCILDSANYDFTVASGATGTVVTGEKRWGYIDITTSTWHTMRMVVKSNYVTVWIDNKILVHKVGVTDPGTNTKILGVQVYGSGSSTVRTLYVDSIKMSSEACEPDPVYPVKIQGQDIVSHIAQVGAIGTLDADVCTPVEYVRYNKNGTVYGFPLVVTDDVQASAVRIYNGTAVKALMKAPTF